MNQEGLCSSQLRQFIDFIHFSLVEHLATTELESLAATNAALDSLILLTKLYKKISVKIDPILGHYLRDPILFTSFMRTVDSRFDHSPLFIDLLAKFFIYSDQLVQTLTVTTDANRYLKDLFDWTSSKFNMSDLHIDQIPICKSYKQRPNNKNSLDNLLVLIEGLDTANCKKAKFCSNQSKRLVNTLNEIKDSGSEVLLNELEELFSFRIFDQMPKKCPSKAELKAYFNSREVYLYSDSLASFEREWTETTEKSSLLTSDEVSVDVDLTSETLSSLLKSDNDNLVNGLVLDKILGKELVAAVEQAIAEDALNEPQITRKNDSPAASSDAIKTPDMINTRTGAKYKAPMRGGHSNPMTRQMLAPATIAAAGLRHDSFRARQPNTSRPPSLHVDEFYKLENASAKQQKILGQNLSNQDKINVRSILLLNRATK